MTFCSTTTVLSPTVWTETVLELASANVPERDMCRPASAGAVIKVSAHTAKTTATIGRNLIWPSSS